MTYLVTLFDHNFQVFKNSPKLTIFGIFNEFLSTQNVNVARFARNNEWDLIVWLTWNKSSDFSNGKAIGHQFLLDLTRTEVAWIEWCQCTWSVFWTPQTWEAGASVLRSTLCVSPQKPDKIARLFFKNSWLLTSWQVSAIYVTNQRNCQRLSWWLTVKKATKMREASKPPKYFD